MWYNLADLLEASLNQMASERKPKVKTRQIHELCAAVGQMRQAYGDTLERFSRRVGISLNSASRFELGKAVPSDPAVLMKLWQVALTLEYEGKPVPQAAELFKAAHNEAEHARNIELWQSPDPRDARAVRADSLTEWRLLVAVSLAQESFPEILPALEDVLDPVLELVDTVLHTIEHYESIDYRELRHRMKQLVDQHRLTEIKTRRKDQ
jgi:transcriptional regulator with XRE-family HTH domain